MSLQGQVKYPDSTIDPVVRPSTDGSYPLQTVGADTPNTSAPSVAPRTNPTCNALTFPSEWPANALYF